MIINNIKAEHSPMSLMKDYTTPPAITTFTITPPLLNYSKKLKRLPKQPETKPKARSNPRPSYGGSP